MLIKQGKFNCVIIGLGGSDHTIEFHSRVEYRKHVSETETVLHREGGPAIIGSDGSEAWFFEGKLHRPDGPAYTSGDGTTKIWADYWCRGGIHRSDGPAVTISAQGNNYSEWWCLGLLHREDGPAVFDTLSGKRSWHFNGVCLGSWCPSDGLGQKKFKTEFCETMFCSGAPHCEDGPAVVVTEDIGYLERGDHLWFKEGKLHREGGPAALDRRSGTHLWMRDGKLHREDGPAVVFPDGSGEEFREGFGISHWQRLKEMERDDASGFFRRILRKLGL